MYVIYFYYVLKVFQNSEVLSKFQIPPKFHNLVPALVDECILISYLRTARPDCLLIEACRTSISRSRDPFFERYSQSRYITYTETEINV